MKYSQKQIKNHSQSLELLDLTRDLTDDEILFILCNWLPSAGDVSTTDVYFTPPHIAHLLTINTADEGHVLDIGAGIGMLSYFQFHKMKWTNKEPRISALELNPDFIKVGKKLMPQINWIEGNATDQETYNKLNPFDTFITNPPFKNSLPFDFIEYGLNNSQWKTGDAILPQSLCNFEYSGKQSHKYKNTRELQKRTRKFLDNNPHVLMSVGVGDTTIKDENYPTMNKFRGTGITVELVQFTQKGE